MIEFIKEILRAIITLNRQKRFHKRIASICNSMATEQFRRSYKADTYNTMSSSSGFHLLEYKIPHSLTHYLDVKIIFDGVVETSERYQSYKYSLRIRKRLKLDDAIVQAFEISLKGDKQAYGIDIQPNPFTEPTQAEVLLRELECLIIDVNTKENMNSELHEINVSKLINNFVK